MTSFRKPSPALLAALLLASCAGGQKPTSREEGSSQGKPVDPNKPAEVQITTRSKLLFEDAVKSFEEQKRLKVFDGQLLEKKFKQVLEADDRFAEAWYNLGIIYERQHRPDDAKKAYKAALERKPSLKQATENLAVMLQNEGRQQDAVALYQDILRRYPDDGAPRARMAAVYLDAGDLQKAMQLAHEALTKDPQNLTAYKVMMQYYFQRNNLNMARLVALRATKLGSDPELFHTMGLIAEKEGEVQGAVAQFRRALQERDDYLPSRVAIARIAVKNLDWTNAADQYQRILKYQPKNAVAHLNLGVAYKGLGQTDKAMAEYEEALKLDSSLALAWYNLGVVYQKHKDAPEKAIESYKKFVAGSRDNVSAEHPVFENIKECEQYMRQLAEAKAAEEQAKREEAEKKKREEMVKQQEAQKAKEAELAKKAAEQEQRQKDAKSTVDAALKPDEKGAKGAPTPAPAPGQESPAPQKADPAPGKDAPAKGGAPGPEAAAAPAGGDEPDDGM